MKPLQAKELLQDDGWFPTDMQRKGDKAESRQPTAIHWRISSERPTEGGSINEVV